MSFDIELMYNGDEVNKIEKEPVSILTITGTLKEETSIVDPVILAEYNGTLNNVNYARIEEFNRYYFITDITSVRTNLWRVSMHCDVLKTYADGILASTGVIGRQERQYNLYLDDYFYKCYQKPLIVNKVFPNGFSSQAFVLAIMGRKDNTSPDPENEAMNSIEGSVTKVEN